MKALSFVRSVPRYLTVRALSRRWPAVGTGPFGCLRLATLEPPPLPGPDWLRIRTRMSGICGSDVATVSCAGSTYFSALTSFPFVLGHEVVGEVEEGGVAGLARGTRVVIEPALGCRVRAIAEPCPACAAGNQGNCLNLTEGRLAAGVQTGYCRDTGGGWGESFVAHVSQVQAIPPEVGDEDAVLIEPYACAIHAVLAAPLAQAGTVLVLGAGSLGLLTLLALKRFAPRARVWLAAKHRHQAELGRALGADDVLPAGRALRDAVVGRTGARRREPELGPSVVLGGVDLTFDCVGSSATVDEAVRLTRARGTVVLVGMPGVLDGLQGTALWFKEVRLQGAYAYGEESVGARRARTFALALEAAAESPGLLARLITSRHRLGDYRRALDQATDTGGNRSIKTVFDLRGDPGC